MECSIFEAHENLYKDMHRFNTLLLGFMKLTGLTEHEIYEAGERQQWRERPMAPIDFNAMISDEHQRYIRELKQTISKTVEASLAKAEADTKKALESCVAEFSQMKSLMITALESMKKDALDFEQQLSERKKEYEFLP
jgi:hypothetical protein